MLSFVLFSKLQSTRSNKAVRKSSGTAARRKQRQRKTSKKIYYLTKKHRSQVIQSKLKYWVPAFFQAAGRSLVFSRH